MLNKFVKDVSKVNNDAETAGFEYSEYALKAITFIFNDKTGNEAECMKKANRLLKVDSSLNKEEDAYGIAYDALKRYLKSKADFNSKREVVESINSISDDLGYIEISMLNTICVAYIDYIATVINSSVNSGDDNDTDRNIKLLGFDSYAELIYNIADIIYLANCKLSMVYIKRELIARVLGFRTFNQFLIELSFDKNIELLIIYNFFDDLYTF